MARILITGASGFLGHNMALGLAVEHQVFACYLRNLPEAASVRAIPLDVTQPVEVSEQLRRLHPELVVHAAAISQPDRCEKGPEEARKVIVEGTRHVARAARRVGCRLVHISTDLVFDGKRGNYTEEDPVAGINVYSSAKIEAEAVVRSIMPAAVILRVSILYGVGNPAHPGFMDTVILSWRSGRPMRFYTDQIRTPTFAPQVAEAVRLILDRRDVRGTFHLGGADRLSRYDFAVLLAGRIGAPPELVQQGSMWEVQGVAPRGADCSLVSEKIQRELGLRVIGCDEGLRWLEKCGYLRPMGE